MGEAGFRAGRGHAWSAAKTLTFEAGRGAVLCALALLVLGMAFEQSARLLETRFGDVKPPGALVQVDGAAMHIWCEGEGDPTIVLESGAAGLASLWETIMEELAPYHRVCAYDRAGLGWSEAATGERGAGPTAERLHGLLRAAGERGPFVLVGHSMGAGFASAFADSHPSEIAGLVLVDPMTPQMARSGSGERVYLHILGQLDAAMVATASGALRLSGAPRRWLSASPPLTRSEAAYFALSFRHLTTAKRELLDWRADSKHYGLEDAARFPLLIVSADRTLWPELVSESDQRTLVEMQAAIGGSHVVIEGSDHATLLVDPAIARAAAREMLTFVAAFGRRE